MMPPEAPESEPVLARFLLVEDMPDSAEVMSLLLESAGYGVRVAHDAEDALAAVQAFTPDAALIDLGLPVVTGFELLSQLKQMPTLANTKYLALTAYDTDDIRKRSAAAGFAVHLTKPVRLELLLESLASLGIATRSK